MLCYQNHHADARLIKQSQSPETQHTTRSILNTIRFYRYFLLFLAGFLSSPLQATPVNINLATSYEIAESLHLPQKVAERV
ncbi:hypothetical protein THMIRHAS_10260 [Thiosulfatimonas sediminis]|uniref:Uncharacterized protein n=1 Tax=Thiosulfatimonas sediminis TaxID=2675054 RepID=A0A6F8PU33_9GAMM|nr:hypothetical protein [Thiosulfatimonas sediminis]BBP45653.1 hypothetical protein THMIRHAS_10260 [Thiosulfatimonas sediminis]